MNVRRVSILTALTTGALCQFAFAEEQPSSQPSAGIRVGYTYKADLFVWPHVKIRWDDKVTPGNPGDDIILQDTYISISNDDIVDHYVKMYFVDGASWNYQDRRMILTGHQPGYFSAYRGTVGLGGVPPFLGLNPQGYQDNPNSNIRQLSGFIIGWTVDANNVPVGTNHLSAEGTIIDYQREAAWEYKPWGFRSLFTGEKQTTDKLLLNGADGEYQNIPSHLLLDFFGSPNSPPPGSGGPSTPGTTAFGRSINIPIVDSSQDFELTLVNMNLDFRAEPDFDMDGTTGELPVPGGSAEDSEPATTAVEVLSWNEAESQISNTHRCVTCWDSTLASRYGFQNGASPFAQSSLQTNKGKARVRGSTHSFCDRPAGSPAANILIYSKLSKNLPILGVAHKIISWGPDRVAKTSMQLIAMGERTDGYVCFDDDDQGTSPTLQAGSAAMVDEGTDSAPTRATRSR